MSSALLRIYLKQNSTCHGKSVHEAVLELLRDSGVSGATLLRGIEGYGTDGKIHTLKILEWSNELPVVVEAVDNEEKIRALVPKLREIVGKELMTMQAVEILQTEKSGFKPQISAESKKTLYSIREKSDHKPNSGSSFPRYPGESRFFSI